MASGEADTRPARGVPALDYHIVPVADHTHIRQYAVIHSLFLLNSTMCYIIHPAPRYFNASRGGVRQNLQKTSRLVSLTMIEFINGGVICFLNSYCEIMQAKPMNPAKFAETNKL